MYSGIATGDFAIHRLHVLIRKPVHHDIVRLAEFSELFCNSY